MVSTRGLALNDFLTSKQIAQFLECKSRGQRLGQAFMNVLDPESYTRLTGTPHDPFYYDTPARVFAAIDFLTEPR